MMRTKIASDIPSGQEIWSGISDIYLTAPDEQGTYSLYKVEHRDWTGNPVHFVFEFERENDS